MRRAALNDPIARRSRSRCAVEGVRHGLNGYKAKGCRCDQCTDAATIAARRWRLRLRGELSPYESPGRTHGTISCYQRARCRCDECRRAAREQRKRLRDRAKAA